MVRGVRRTRARVRSSNALFFAVLAIVVVLGSVIYVRTYERSIPLGPGDDRVLVATPMPTIRTPEPLRGPPPNIVLILTDDQRADSLRVMPNVKRLLIDRGVTFENAFASTPVCCPSRASIYTGRHSFRTKVFDSRKPNGGVEAFSDDSTLATWLNDAGYATAFAGRYLNGYEVLGEQSFVPSGWDDWHAWLTDGRGVYYDYRLNENGEVRRFGRTASEYLTDVLADRATSFIASAQRPFFVHFAPLAPHAPAVPAQQDIGTFADEPLDRPPSYDVVADGDVPAADLPPLPDFIKRYADGYRRSTLESLQAVDRAIASIVEAVDARGELDKTLFVFTSDNGHLQGEHRIFNAAWAYEPSIRVPLVIRAPGSADPFIERRLVQNVDIAPTITELTGVRPGLRPDGTSLVPLLRREDVRWRQETYFEYLGDRERYDSPPPYIAIRTDRHKLIVYADGSRELFDVGEDPHEMRNLAGTTEASEIEGPLYRRLGRLTTRGRLPSPTRSASPTPAPITAPPTGTPDFSRD